MSLDTGYMKMRHPEIKNPSKEEFGACFDRDFREGLSAGDYLWPVSLATVVCLVGWFLTLSRVYPSFSGMKEAGTFLPATFAFGFVGAYLASLLNIFDQFRTLNLDPSAYYSIVARLLFSSTAAYLVGQVLKDTFSGLAAVGIGLIPVEEVRDFNVQAHTRTYHYDPRRPHDLRSRRAVSNHVVRLRRNRQSNLGNRPEWKQPPNTKMPCTRCQYSSCLNHGSDKVRARRDLFARREFDRVLSMASIIEGHGITPESVQCLRDLCAADGLGTAWTGTKVPSAEEKTTTTRRRNSSTRPASRTKSKNYLGRCKLPTIPAWRHSRSSHTLLGSMVPLEITAICEARPSLGNIYPDSRQSVGQSQE
jgi:hypothetical protein